MFLNTQQVALFNQMFDILIEECKTDPDRRSEFIKALNEPTFKEFNVGGCLGQTGVFSQDYQTSVDLHMATYPKRKASNNANKKIIQLLEKGNDMKTPQSTDKNKMSNKQIVVKSFLERPLVMRSVPAKVIHEQVKSYIPKIATLYGTLNSLSKHGFIRRNTHASPFKYELCANAIPKDFWADIQSPTPIKKRTFTKKGRDEQITNIVQVLSDTKKGTWVNTGLIASHVKFSSQTVVRRLKELESRGIIVSQMSVSPHVFKLNDGHGSITQKDAMDKFHRNNQPVKVKNVNDQTLKQKPNKVSMDVIFTEVEGGASVPSFIPTCAYTGLIIVNKGDGRYGVEIEF
ncbi:hypothetical protein LCGC14_0146070 [marine sediment metagenome]|uniref:Uncharacterized protein n=1 Tax=marine sediment metagenome TaxID=412755 RepID=A0A0F9XHG5_9ZZZZ